MNKLQKILLGIIGIILILVFYFLFIFKYDRYGNCAVIDFNKINYLSIDDNSYRKLEDKSIIKIHNGKNAYEIKTYSRWTFLNNENLWITQINKNKKVAIGNYMIFLTKKIILNI